MRAKKRKAARHDSIEAGVIPPLWVKENGDLQLEGMQVAGSSGLLLPRSQLSPRKEVIRARRLLLSRSFWSWLSSKNSAGAGTSMGAVSLFEMWLSLRLEICAFNCESVGDVLANAEEELRLERWEAVRLLLLVTRRDARFKSVGGVVSFR